MKNLTKKLGMLMLVLVLALCPMIAFTGCSEDKTDDSVALTIEQAEAVLKTMIISYDSNNVADTTRYVGIPNYVETTAVSSGTGSVKGTGVDYSSITILRLDNQAGELQIGAIGSESDGSAESFYFIHNGEYYHGSASGLLYERETQEWDKSRYYGMMLGEDDFCIYVASSYSVWAWLGFVQSSGSEVATRQSYSANGNVYTINYKVVDAYRETDNSNSITAHYVDTCDVSISFDVTTQRICSISMDYVESVTYSGSGSFYGETVTEGQVENNWGSMVQTYNYNLILPFSVPQSYIDNITAGE